MLKIEQDIKADVMYLYLNTKTISHSVELHPDTIILDVSDDGFVVGIELRNVSTWLSETMEPTSRLHPVEELRYMAPA